MKIKKSLFGYTKKSSSKKSIKLGRPDKWEVLFLILYGLSWYWFNDIVNVMSARGGWNIMAGVTSTLNIGLIIPMWITFIAFHIFLMLVIGRSIWSKEKGNTHHYIDLFVGIIILLGFIAFSERARIKLKNVFHKGELPL